MLYVRMIEYLYFIGMLLFSVSSLILIILFIRGSFLVERLRKIILSLGNDDSTEEAVWKLIKYLEKHEVPLRLYARDLIRSAYKLVIANNDIDEGLKEKLYKKILARGILI